MKSVFQFLLILIVAYSGNISAQEVTPVEIKKEHKKTIVIQKQDKDGNIIEERFETENGQFSPDAKQKMKELKMEMKESVDGENVTIEITEEKNINSGDRTRPKWLKKGIQNMKGRDRALKLQREILQKRMHEKKDAIENKAVLGIGIDDTTNGVKISEIIPGSAAESSDLRRGDVILKINDKYIFSSDGLLEALHPFNPGDKVKVRYLRDGKEKSTSVVLKANN